MTPFTPIDYDEATERRLAIRLWTLYLTFVVLVVLVVVVGLDDDRAQVDECRSSAPESGRVLAPPGSAVTGP